MIDSTVMSGSLQATLNSTERSESPQIILRLMPILTEPLHVLFSTMRNKPVPYVPLMNKEPRLIANFLQTYMSRINLLRLINIRRAIPTNATEPAIPLHISETSADA